MVDNIKRVLHQPASKYTFPMYLRTANDRYFIKLKSGWEVTWLEFVDSEKFKVRTTGSSLCGSGEYFDIDFFARFCSTLTEKDYLTRLKEFTEHFEYIKTALKL